jgi:hypothetical protein
MTRYLSIDDELDQYLLAGRLRDYSLLSQIHRLRNTWDDMCSRLSYLEPPCYTFDWPRALFFGLRW